jgi:hypothetical protein
MTCVINKPTKEHISKYYKDTINKNRVFDYNYELYENYDYTKLLSCIKHNIKIVFPSNIKQKLKTHFNFELNDRYSNHCHTTDFNNIKHIVGKFSMFSIYNKERYKSQAFINGLLNGDENKKIGQNLWSYSYKEKRKVNIYSNSPIPSISVSCLCFLDFLSTTF